MQERFYIEPYLTRLETTVVSQDELGVVLADTIFYPVGGGQPADTGTLTAADGYCYSIVNTVRDPDTRLITHCMGAAPALKPGDTVTLDLDWVRRHRHMRMHTCQHLLSVILPVEITGGNLSTEGSRLDFNLPEGMTLDKQVIQESLDRLIAEDHPLHLRLISRAELQAQPELVKTMSAPPPTDVDEIHLVEIEGIDLQSCAGTHVKSTAEVGRVIVKKIENKGARNKRVHVVFAD